MLSLCANQNGRSFSLEKEALAMYRFKNLGISCSLQVATHTDHIPLTACELARLRPYLHIHVLEGKREEESGRERGGGNTFEVKRASYWHRRMTEACRLPSAVLICQDPQISVSIKSCSFGFDKPSKFIVGCSKRYFFSVFGSCFSFSTVFLFILFPAFATEIG